MTSVRIRCYDCYRPQAMCFCSKIPRIDNRTEVIVLQHMRERFHAFNTARIVRKALNHATLLVDHNHSLAVRLGELPLTHRIGVLYPGPGGRLLTDVPAGERPEQLIVIDGTWHHAKTLLRDIPLLSELPRYRIDPAEPGRYRIRREPNETALSTLEATVAALRALEPDTHGLDELVSAFDSMVESQLDQVTSRTSWRQNQRRQHNTLGIPRAILGGTSEEARADLQNVVVAYGESEPGIVGDQPSSRAKSVRQPIYWVAHRMDTDDWFRSAIESPVNLPSDFLDHVGLTRDEWGHASTVQQFNNDWSAFIRPEDTLVTYHAGTLRLIRNLGAAVPNPVILKSVKVDPLNEHRSLESFLQSKQINIATPKHPSRADQRLSSTIALTRYLHQLGRS